MSLKQLAQKIKSFSKLTISSILLIDLYILGYINSIPKREVKVVFDYFVPDFYSELDNGSDIGGILASKNGTKYYFSHCSGAKRIKEENIIYFSSEEEAISKGFEKAKNCN